MSEAQRQYDRLMLRSGFQSLFWTVILSRKRENKLTLKALADKLGVHKSYVSRSFSAPPNWQIDKISDMADALGVDIVLEARDRVTGIIYTPSGVRHPATTSSSIEQVPTVRTGSTIATTTEEVPGRHVVLPCTGTA